MDVTYPKDALGKNYMHTASWNNKFYIRTGLATVTSAFSTTVNAASATFAASQMQYIANKFSYPIIVGAGYPPALAAGQRVVSVSGSIYVYNAPNAAGTASAACAITDGAGGYKYNIQNGGKCDMLWQIDY